MMLFGHQNDAGAAAEQNSFVVGSAPTNTTQDDATAASLDSIVNASLPAIATDMGQPTDASNEPVDTAVPDAPAPDQDSLSIPSIESEEQIVTAALPETVETPVEPQAPLVNDLLSIKQDALQQLSPLVDHLDQTPEEKFRTTMMMIQSSDNQGLIKDAYAAAQAIPDDKIRAQALLDVINEINYFTQQSKK